MDFADASIAVGENVVHYRHDGLPAHAVDVPIVLVHGLSGATTWWAKNPAVLGQGAEIYALDLPEFGRSRAGGAFDIRHETTVLASCMAAIGVGRAIVGGKIAGASSTRPATVFGARLRAIQSIGRLLADSPELDFGHSAFSVVKADQRCNSCCAGFTMCLKMRDITKFPR